jgi:hypothetical protein
VFVTSPAGKKGDPEDSQEDSQDDVGRSGSGAPLGGGAKGSALGSGSSSGSGGLSSFGGGSASASAHASAAPHDDGDVEPEDEAAEREARLADMQRLEDINRRIREIEDAKAKGAATGAAAPAASEAPKRTGSLLLCLLFPALTHPHGHSFMFAADDSEEYAEDFGVYVLFGFLTLSFVD